MEKNKNICRHGNDLWKLGNIVRLSQSTYHFDAPASLCCYPKQISTKIAQRKTEKCRQEKSYELFSNCCHTRVVPVIVLYFTERCCLHIWQSNQCFTMQVCVLGLSPSQNGTPITNFRPNYTATSVFHVVRELVVIEPSTEAPNSTSQPALVSPPPSLSSTSPFAVRQHWPCEIFLMSVLFFPFCPLD